MIDKLTGALAGGQRAQENAGDDRGQPGGVAKALEELTDPPPPPINLDLGHDGTAPALPDQQLQRHLAAVIGKLDNSPWPRRRRLAMICQRS